MATATKVATGGASALLASMAAAGGATGKKGKPSKPMLRDPALDKDVDDYIKAKRDEEDAKALGDSIKDRLCQRGLAFRLEHCRATQKVEASIGINGKLTMTRDCRYTAVDANFKPALEETFGASSAVYFSDALQIGLTDEAAADADFLETLMEAVGADVFAAKFTVKRTIKPTERFHSDVTLDVAVAELAQPYIDQQVIKPYAPSLKVA